MENTMENRPVALRISGLKKMYKLGQIGGGTLQADLQSWWARVRGKEDPNAMIGQDARLVGQTFMALNGIDLTVYQGEAVGIIGCNGAGKSTLLKLISQVTAPTEGEIELYGRVASMLEVGTGFNGELTGRENAYMNGAILGMTRAEIDKKIEQIIDFSEVREFIDTPVKRYSSGMYVKLAFSVAAHLDSEILIMDEVLAVGDMAFQKKCLKKMREAATLQGRTVLYVSHNMNTVRELCDRCIVLDKGKVIFNGSVEDAIDIYSGAFTGEVPAHYDLSRTPRSLYDRGVSMRMMALDFPGKEKAMFFRSELLRFRISMEAHENLDGLQMYMTINDDKGNPVGTTLTAQDFWSCKVGQKETFEFQFDTACLATGNYSFEPIVYLNRQGADVWVVDHAQEPIRFSVVDDEQLPIPWKIREMGLGHLPKLTAQRVTE